MQVPVIILSVIETAINTWLKLDPDSVEKLSDLQGKIIRLHITGLEFNLYMLPSSTGIQVLGQYPDEEAGAQVDAIIHASPMSLMRMSTANSAGETMLESDIEIEGDMKLAEQFSDILKNVDIDWEEILSKLVGDIIANQAGQTTKAATGWIKDSFSSLQMNTGEYLSEESRLTPTETEIDVFIADVDTIRADIDRLEARIKALQPSDLNE